jgi:ribosomal protein L21E
MRRFEEGDQVRIDIPDKDDPDHSRLHLKTGMIV